MILALRDSSKCNPLIRATTTLVQPNSCLFQRLDKRQLGDAPRFGDAVRAEDGR